MADFDLVVRGGTVVTAEGTARCDVGIRDGRIAALGIDLPPGARELDAKDRLVLPGGIDSHCHIEQRVSSGVQNADSWESGTVSAACGGTTTVICFAVQPRGGSIAEAVDAYARLATKAVIDHAFHLQVTDPSPQALGELNDLIAQGHRSLKVFMTNDSVRLDDRQMLEVLAAGREHGALTVIHAENSGAIAFLTDRLLAAGLGAPRYFEWSRPAVVEREAVTRAIALAELVDAPVQIFHVSAAEAAEEIRRARARGVKVWGETCAQYLLLSDADTNRPGFEGAKYICSPAPRGAGNREALWALIRGGVLDIVSSDHAPHRYDDPKGKKLNGEDAPFSRIPNGVPGVETRLPVLFSEGVSAGRIDLPTFVALSSTNPAKLFGLYPKKGAITVGSDADIAVWDPRRRVTIRNAMLHHNVDYTPFEGYEATGWPVTTLSRGEVLCDEGAVTAASGRGRLLLRPAYDTIRPTGRFTTPFDPVHGRIVHD
ncbi:MAG: dihydropyrimidinase [Acetobacterales bacterium]